MMVTILRRHDNLNMKIHTPTATIEKQKQFLQIHFEFIAARLLV
jgi:hypothetical protein